MRATLALIITAFVLGSAAGTSAQLSNPSVTQCGELALSDGQRDFAAGVAFMSDAARASLLGTGDDPAGQIHRCASQVREAMCSNDVIMSLLGADSYLWGAAAGAGIAGMTGGGIVEGAIGGAALLGPVIGVVGSAASMKACAERRSVLTGVADRLRSSDFAVHRLGGQVDYQTFHELVAANARRSVTLEEGETLLRAARELGAALNQTVR